MEKRTAPTRDWVLEMGSVTTMDLMKLSISLKLPRPWYSMLPDPSIRKPKSTTVLHTGTTKDKKVYMEIAILTMNPSMHLRKALA